MRADPTLLKVRVLFSAITLSAIIGSIPLVVSIISWNTEACGFKQLPEVRFFFADLERCAAEKSVLYLEVLGIPLVTLLICTIFLFIYDPDRWRLSFPSFNNWTFKPLRFSFKWKMPKPSFKFRLELPKSKKSAVAKKVENRDIPTHPVIDINNMMGNLGRNIGRGLQAQGSVGTILIMVCGLQETQSKSFIVLDSKHTVEQVPEAIKHGFVSVTSSEIYQVTVHSQGIKDLTMLITVATNKPGCGKLVETTLSEFLNDLRIPPISSFVETPIQQQ